MGQEEKDRERLISQQQRGNEEKFQDLQEIKTQFYDAYYLESQSENSNTVSIKPVISVL